MKNLKIIMAAIMLMATAETMTITPMLKSLATRSVAAVNDTKKYAKSLTAVLMNKKEIFPENSRLKEKEEYLIKKGLFTENTVPPVLLPLNEHGYIPAYCSVSHIGISHCQSNATLLHEASHWINNDLTARVRSQTILYGLIASYFTYKGIDPYVLIEAPSLFTTTKFLNIAQGNYHERRADNLMCKYSSVKELIEAFFDFATYNSVEREIILNGDFKDNVAILTGPHPRAKNRMIKIIDAIVKKATDEDVDAFDEYIDDIVEFVTFDKDYDNKTEHITRIKNYESMCKIVKEYKQKVESTNKYNQKELKTLEAFTHSLLNSERRFDLPRVHTLYF